MSNKKINPSMLRNVRYRYVPVQETVTDDEGNRHVTYGLSVRTVEDEIIYVSDVSTDFEELAKLADVCTEKGLEPIHLDDVIEDFLAEGCLTLS